MPLPKFSRLSRVIYNNKKKLLLVFFFLLALFLVSQISKIKQIECAYNTVPCQKEMLDKLSAYQNKNYFQIGSKEIIDKLSSIQPVDELKTYFMFPGKLRVEINSKENFKEAIVYYLTEKPQLSLDNSLISSESAFFVHPTSEIEDFLKDKSGSGVQIWSNGKIISKEVQSSNIKMIIGQNPQVGTLVQIYNFLELIKPFGNFKSVFVIDDLIFLSREGLPDIIVIVPFDESRLKVAFSSLEFLNSLKKDAKVIDMRFKNPIVR